MSNNNILLADQNGNNVASVGEATVATSSNAITWTFLNNGFAISAGGSYTFTLRANTSVVPSIANVSQSFSANIQSASDVQYADGLDSAATTGLGLPASVVPLTINSITYPVGQ